MIHELAIDTIRQECGLAARVLKRVAEDGVKAMHHFRFNIGGMREYMREDIRKSLEHRSEFERLAAVRGPVVYVFEICPPSSPTAVLAAARAYVGPRAVPAQRSRIDETSSVLYVGKVKKAFEGRVIQHLGFSRTAATQGLQLYHWTRGMALELQLTAFEFEDDMVDLLPLVERVLAQKLSPLLGKHQ